MTGLAAGLALVAASAAFVPFFALRETRASSGHGVILSAALPGAAWIAFALAAALAAAAYLSARGPRSLRRAFSASSFVLAASAAPLALWAFSEGTGALGLAAGPLARVSFGAGFWACLLGAWLAVRGTQTLLRRAASPGLGAVLPSIALVAAAAAAAAIGLTGGWADAGVVREYASRRSRFAEAAAVHLAYAAFPTMAAAAAGLPLGWAASRSPSLEKPLFALATAVQTIPTLSLLGLLVVPLSALGRAVPALGALGVSGVGWAPASIALFLYALLPVIAHAAAGFSRVPAEARDAALGIGMTGRQVFARVDLPLAAPSLVAGLRTALAQNLGNATLAGLIGGGGLGGIVLLGLAQAAPDLMLLGALPVAAMALAADGLLGAAESAASAAAGAYSRGSGRGADGEPQPATSRAGRAFP